MSEVATERRRGRRPPAASRPRSGTIAPRAGLLVFIVAARVPRSCSRSSGCRSWRSGTAAAPTARRSGSRASGQPCLDDGRAGARLARDRARARHGARVGRDARSRRGCGCCEILPILPIVVPAVASVLGWSFLFSPHPGYLNALLRHLPWWQPSLRGPGRHLHAAVDRDRHRPRADVVHLPVRQRRVREHQRRAARGRAGLGLVAGRRVLPRHAAAPAPRAHLRRAAWRSCSGSASSPAPLLLGSNNNISVLTTEMYRATQQTPPQYDVAAALGSPLLVFGRRDPAPEQAAPRRHVDGSSRTAASRSVRSRAARRSPLRRSSCTGSSPRCCRSSASCSWASRRTGQGSSHPSQFTLNAFHTIFHDGAILTAIRTSLVTSLIAVAVTLPRRVLRGRRCSAGEARHRVAAADPRRRRRACR